MTISRHNHFMHHNAEKWLSVTRISLFMLGALLALPAFSLRAAESGVTDTVIRIGSTQPLIGDISPIGEGMKKGMEAAFKNAKVQGRTIELTVLDDSYDPTTTIKDAQELINQGIFLMLGSTGSQSMKAVLPVLAAHKVPAVGFYTGAGFTGPGDVLNFRSSYAQEVATAINAVLAAGVKPTEICAYVQNDAYGMAGLKGVRIALEKQAGMQEVVDLLDKILVMEGEDPERNNIGPVGVNRRGTLTARDGYLSLKDWEKKTGNRCRFVATVLNILPTVQFIGYAHHYKKEPWVFSVPSPAVNETLLAGFKEQSVSDNVIATRVIPAETANMPIVNEARQALGKDFNAFSLEGYVVGKMTLAIMRNIQGDLTRANFLAAARSQPYDIGGIAVDFTNDSQGSDFVDLTYLQNDLFEPLSTEKLQAIFREK